MSFPAYPDYKQTDMLWVGAMPKHWESQRLKSLFHLVKRPPRDTDGIVTAFRDGQVTLRSNRREDGFTNALQEIGYQGVRSGDLVIHAMDAFAGAVGVSDSDGKSSPVYSVCIPRTGANPRYFGLAIRHMALSGFVNSLAKGVRERSTEFRWADASVQRFPVPPLNEQDQIISFIDRETAKIDALIEEQRRLIALLKKKRQAVISHAVTKGLDPHAPVKDSGIEWLGEVPAHWAITKFSRAIAFQEGPGIMAADFHEEGVPLMRVAGASGRWASLEGCNYLDPEKVATRWNHFRLELGDLIISGSASMGTVCEVGPEAAGAVPYTGLIRLTPIAGEATRDFARAIVGSSLFLTQIDLLKAGATIQHFGPTHLRQMIIVLPPLAEQAVISEHVDRLNDRYRDLTLEAEQTIALLNERRAALISAAVTGKIDVRASAKVLPFPIERARARALVGTEIIERSAGQPTFGRVKFQKVAFLAEGHVGISELAGSYTRAAAGPLDGALIEDMERGAHNIAGIAVDQAGGTGTTVSYRLGQQRGGHRQELADWLGPDRTAKLNKLIADFAPLNTKQAEAVATLYGVWNDLLSDGGTASDDEIITGFLNDWHPEKREKFRSSELPEWLCWMRRHGIVPTGSGPKTTTGRLFV